MRVPQSGHLSRVAMDSAVVQRDFTTALCVRFGVRLILEMSRR